MEKSIVWMVLLSMFVSASESRETPKTVQDACLSCHVRQQIPSELIYRRYLMKYSTRDRIEKAMFAYLKEPLQSRSIMPQQFFLKFPMKEAAETEEKELRREIRTYLERFDIKKKLVLEKI